MNFDSIEIQSFLVAFTCFCLTQAYIKTLEYLLNAIKDCFSSFKFKKFDKKGDRNV